MIAYFYCICKSKDRLLAAKLKSKGFEIRTTKNNPEWSKEAKAYGVKLPFIVSGEKVTELINGGLHE